MYARPVAVSQNGAPAVASSASGSDTHASSEATASPLTEPVQPGGQECGAHPLSGQRNESHVRAGVDGQPERVGHRRHRHGVQVGGRGIDDIAGPVQEEPDGDRDPWQPPLGSDEGPSQRREGGREDDGVIDPGAEQLVSPEPPSRNRACAHSAARRAAPTPSRIPPARLVPGATSHPSERCGGPLIPLSAPAPEWRSGHDAQMPHRAARAARARRRPPAAPRPAPGRRSPR